MQRISERLLEIKGKGRSLFYHVWHSRERGGAYFTMCGRAEKGEEPILPCVAEQGKGRSLFYHVWQSMDICSNLI
jgi:hypothetical protein